MFVFPAQNSNFKSRKRTFRCCERCRVKRVKCNIQVENFLTKGCQSCQQRSIACSLIGSSVDHNATKVKGYFNLNDLNGFKDKPSPSPLLGPSLNLDHSFEQISEYQAALNVPLEFTNPQLLKKLFNFNLSILTDKSYEYLLYSHPKAVIESKMQEDASVYHESGIIIPELSIDKSRANSLNELVRFKNMPQYQFLLQIYAFTLSSPGFCFKVAEIEKLLEIYFFKINGIFPIIHEQEFWENYRAGKEPTIIIFAAVLLILRDKLAAEIFRKVFLRDLSYVDNEPLFHQKLEIFTDSLDFKIRQLNLALEDLGDYNKLNRMVTMLLLSLRYRFTCSGGEQSSQDLTCGINLAFAMAIHMKPTKKFYDSEKAAYLSDLWWTCYAMDRFNSVSNFRCFFIKHEDFNIDLPYGNLNLLQIVQLAKSLENMLIALYQPFNNVHMKDQNNDIQHRLKIFNAADFQELEFNLCSHEIASDSVIFDQSLNLDNFSQQKEAFVKSTLHLLSRLINNTIILVSQKGFFNDPTIHNLIPKKSILRASGNVLWYMKKIPEKLTLQAPILIFCLLISMSCGLKMRARNILGTVDSELDDVKPSFEMEGYMLELERFRRGWWVVDDVYKLAKDFIEQLVETEKKRKEIELSLLKVKKEDIMASPESTMGLRSTNSTASILNILRVAELDSIDSFSVDGLNFFSGWDFSKIAQYDNFFESMQDDLFNIDMFSM